MAPSVRCRPRSPIGGCWTPSSRAVWLRSGGLRPGASPILGASGVVQHDLRAERIALLELQAARAPNRAAGSGSAAGRPGRGRRASRGAGRPAPPARRRSARPVLGLLAAEPAAVGRRPSGRAGRVRGACAVQSRAQARSDRAHLRGVERLVQAADADPPGEPAMPGRRRTTTLPPPRRPGRRASHNSGSGSPARARTRPTCAQACRRPPRQPAPAPPLVGEQHEVAGLEVADSRLIGLLQPRPAIQKLDRRSTMYLRYATPFINGVRMTEQ